MSNNVVEQQTQELSVWDDKEKLKLIKASKAKNCSDLEFQLFMEMGKRLGLNPLLNEIWCIKYDKNAPAQIFMGINGYRKIALEQKGRYNGHKAIALYENYIIRQKDNGALDFEFTSFGKRGRLIGAYAELTRKDIDQPFFILVEFEEYKKPFGKWKESPAAMITKVAEAQVLRMAFQGAYAGTYEESEAWVDLSKEEVNNQNKKSNNQKPIETNAVVMETEEEKQKRIQATHAKANDYIEGIINKLYPDENQLEERLKFRNFAIFEWIGDKNFSDLDLDEKRDLAKAIKEQGQELYNKIHQEKGEQNNDVEETLI